MQLYHQPYSSELQTKKYTYIILHCIMVFRSQTVVYFTLDLLLSQELVIVWSFNFNIMKPATKSMRIWFQVLQTVDVNWAFMYSWKTVDVNWAYMYSLKTVDWNCAFMYSLKTVNVNWAFMYSLKTVDGTWAYMTFWFQLDI